MIHNKCGNEAQYIGVVDRNADNKNKELIRYWCRECVGSFDVVVGAELKQLDNNHKSIKELTKEGVI